MTYRLSRDKCLRFNSRCLHGRRVWNLPDIKFIIIRFREEKKTISFLNWQRVDKYIAKINQSLPFDQAIEKWNSKQVASYNQRKLDLKPGETLFHVDYSEIYSSFKQDEVQFAYFGQ